MSKCKNWVQKIKNTEALEGMNKAKGLLTTIKIKKTQYFGHITRDPKYELLRLIIIEGELKGKRLIGI